ncbi:10078_t:CDS:2, partial [Funneliformis geosporum]
EPLDIVRISTALFVRVEKGEWTGVLKKEVENFEQVLQRVLEQVPSEDIERVKKLRSFGTGKKLAKRYGITTSEEADRDVGRCISESTSYEKTMWERIEIELEEINVENLGFDHPICSGVLDIKSEPFTDIPGSVCDIFKEPFQKYKLEQNHDIMEA